MDLALDRDVFRVLSNCSNLRLAQESKPEPV